MIFVVASALCDRVTFCHLWPKPPSAGRLPRVCGKGFVGLHDFFPADRQSLHPAGDTYSANYHTISRVAAIPWLLFCACRGTRYRYFGGKLSIAGGQSIDSSISRYRYFRGKVSIVWRPFCAKKEGADRDFRLRSAPMPLSCCQSSGLDNFTNRGRGALRVGCPSAAPPGSLCHR